MTVCLDLRASDTLPLPQPWGGELYRAKATGPRRVVISVPKAPGLLPLQAGIDRLGALGGLSAGAVGGVGAMGGLPALVTAAAYEPATALSKGGQAAHGTHASHGTQASHGTC